MHSNTFISLVSWVVAHGYFLFFIAALLEGPLVTMAAGVACALGYYDIWIILFLSVMGDLVADVVWYSLGYFGRRVLVQKFAKFFGANAEKIKKLEAKLHRNTGKAITFVKLSPLIPVPGIILIGSLRVPLKKFVKYSLYITLPKSLAFGLLGLIVGKAYVRYSGTLANSEYAFYIIALILILVYIGYTKFSERLSKNIDKVS